MDPATMAMMASVASSLFGSKQLGGVAPAFNAGQSGGVAGGAPAGDQGMGLLGAAGIQTPDPFQGALSALGQMQGGQQSPAPQEPPKPSAFDSGAFGMTQDFQNPIQGGGALGLTKDFGNPLDKGPEKQTGLGGFLGGIDKGLQSPSQMLGLGLLSQLGGNSNALPLAGLLGMGMYNRNK